MAATIKPLSCPFCGSRECVVGSPDASGLWSFWVECGDCSTRGPESGSADGALDLWNRRHEEKTDAK